MDNIRKILAENVRQLMGKSSDCQKQKALGIKSGVSQRTISNILNPDKHDMWPQLDSVQLIAECFGVEAWRLLHPTMGDKEFTDKEIQMYRRWREEIKQLQNQ
jgi:transcriptional regulator with XRE-family HTH domain